MNCNEADEEEAKRLLPPPHHSQSSFCMDPRYPNAPFILEARFSEISVIGKCMSDDWDFYLENDANLEA